MRSVGIKASELIEQLRDLIEQHGDQEVIAGGTDYPEGVRGVVSSNGDTYTPKGSFKIL